MYKKIMNFGKSDSIKDIDDFKEEFIQEQMKQMTDDINSLLYSLYNIATSSNDPAVMEHFMRLLEFDIEPVLSQFN